MFSSNQCPPHAGIFLSIPTYAMMDKNKSLSKIMMPQPSSPTPSFQWLSRLQERLTDLVMHIKLFIVDLSFVRWAKQYTPSQLLYFSAMICLVVSIFDDGNSTFIATILFAFTGLIRELLNLFQKVWATTIGKSLILILYASTANLALAFAALKINQITGVEPTPFVFTLGFTTLVLMPFWIAVSQILIFLVGLILANLWLLLSVPLKLFGIQLKVHWEDTQNAIITMLFRIILIPIVLSGLITIITPYLASSLDTNGIQFEIGTEQAQPVELSLANIEQDEVGLEQLEDIQAKAQFIDQAIATFIYHLEAYPNSMCQKADNERTVILDDFSILLIAQSEESPLGYSYRVAKCRYTYE